MIWTEEDLHNIRARDQETFSRLYNEYKTKIYNFLIVKANGNRDVAEDVFSDTFQSALLSAPKLKNVNSILSWLIQIANRRFFDYLRKHYKEKEYIDKFNDEEFTDNNSNGNLEIKEQVTILNMALENINPKYSEVIKLKYNDHRSQKEIAKILNKTESAVENLLFKARKELKAKIDQLYKDF